MNIASTGPFLTPRQLEVLELMAKGLVNREIAGVLGIAAGTVKNHVAAVIDALDVTNRTEAATRLHELGLGSDRSGVREEFRVEGFGSRPAIAVLPFDNLSGDPDQDFLADGIVEDLITRLASWRWFPVIARNSTFVYKGKSVDVKEVSRALGAGFVIEGSVRRVGDRLRVTVQVLEGQSATHVWAERYDREVTNLFDITDELVDSVVATLEPALLKISGVRGLSTQPDQLEAWEILQRAFVSATQNSLNGLLSAQALVDNATQLDPGLVMAHGLSTYIQFHLHLWNYRYDHGLPTPAERLSIAARRLVELDTTDPFSHMGMAMSELVQGDREHALASADRALELNPSLVWALLTHAVACLANGRPTECQASLDRAIRLSPQDPLLAVIHSTRGVCFTQLGRLDEAEVAYRDSLREGPGLPYAYVWLAIFYALRNEHDEARALIDRMKEVAPNHWPMVSAHVFAPPESQVALGDLFALVGFENEPPS